ncbi:DNA-directed RNA polymerase III subunit C31 [Emydomyces testavorans]|uniref:DNA-directed RNA polymerase III subunit n=1 Tax=Emydomyces testavorans TaxID=2070801 RepID=A0AAF0DDF3_9EURO|nr:DNA-directed RNA polymerase III subunit C31 [Emydomyces testavorans]
MSRRGGGGARGKRLPGAEFSWQSEPGAEADTAPTPLFPKYKVPRAKPLSPLEAPQVDHYRKLREKIHNGPFYTVLSGPPSYGRGGPPARAQFDPFQGMATYGQRYLKKARTLPKLSGIPFEMNFFPKELWSTLDPKYVGLPGGMGNSLGALARAGQKRGFEDDEEEEAADAMRKRQAVDEEEDEGSDANKRGDTDDEAGLEDEGEGEGEEEIVDDDFEEDEEDMGGDYNAEQYFDGGDEVDDYGDGDLGDGDVY